MSQLKLAEALGMNAADLKDYEYQPTVWNHRIYAIGTEYYTLTRGQRAPRVVGKWAADVWGMEWRPVDPAHLHLAPAGYTVWVSR